MKLYVEGGGDGAALRTACRKGFSGFLNKAGLGGNMPRVVACGSREDAYASFCTAIRQGDAAMLLVDAEAPVQGDAQPGDGHDPQARERWQPWLHLQRAAPWRQPAGSETAHCHLMVQCMEAWLLADRGALAAYFGQGFQESALPAESRSVEDVAKEQLLTALAAATRGSKTKGAYRKSEHSFNLLALVAPAKVCEASPWAQRFIDALRSHAGLRG